MAKNLVCMMIKDEEFYIEMALLSVLDHADVLILDTGSTDRTVEIIKVLQLQYPNKITLLEDTFGSNEFENGEFRFAKGFRQNEARNFLMKNAVDRLGPDDFLIHIDADEVLNDRFWEILKSTGEDALGHSTDLPITPFSISTHPLDMQKWGLFKLFDPHIRAWRVNLKAKWWVNDENAGMGGELHPIIQWGRPPRVEVTEDNIHFHLHYSFGPKSIYSYICPTEQTTNGAAQILNVPLREMYNQKYFEDHFSDWFKDGRFVPKDKDETVLWNKHSRFSVQPSHPLPEFVIKRWLEWGEPLAS